MDFEGRLSVSDFVHLGGFNIRQHRLGSIHQTRKNACSFCSYQSISLIGTNSTIGLTGRIGWMEKTC